MNWCPKLFVLYVLNCTVSKLHFGDSSLFPFKSFYCSDRPLKDIKKTKTKKKYRESETECTQRMSGLFNEGKKKQYNPTLSLFIQSCICWVMFFLLILFLILFLCL